MTDPPVAPDDTPHTTGGFIKSEIHYRTEPPVAPDDTPPDLLPSQCRNCGYSPEACVQVNGCCKACTHVSPMPYQWVAPDDTPTPQTTGLVEILNRDQLLAEVSRLREDLEYIQSHYQREIENGEKKMGWLREKTAQIVEAEAEVSRLQQENALLKRSLGVLTEECQKWQEEAELAAGAIDELIIKHRDDDTVIERATERLTEAYQTIEELEGRLVVQGQSIEHYQARLKDLEPAEADESKSRH